MVKKEFRNQTLRRLNNLSDIELIEELEKSTYGSGEFYNNLIKALLDKGLKIAVQDLTKNIKNGNEITKKYNKRLVGLTIVIVTLTLLMLIGLGIQIHLLVK